MTHDADVPRNRNQPQRAGGQLQASQRKLKNDFAGTDLMPSANGVAEVNSKRGAIEIEAEFGDLRKPTTFGNEYLTYVLWAISPKAGR